MKQYQTLTLTALMLILCLNFTQGSADCDDIKPSWNCQGTLIDSEGREHAVEFLTISGVYEKVPVYYEPDSPDKKPSGHTQLISLRDIKKITADPTESKKEFMGRQYVEITVLFKKGAQEKYLVEEYRELWYFLPKGPSGRAEVKFDRIKSLTIDKCSVRMQDNQEKDSGSVEEPTNVQANLHHSSLLTTMKDSLNVAVATVKDSFKHLFA